MKNRLRRFFAGLVPAVGLLSATGCFTASDLRFYNHHIPDYRNLITSYNTLSAKK